VTDQTEVERLRDENIEQDKEIQGYESAVIAYEKTIHMLREALEEYGEHAQSCILSRYEAGEPTPSGGYRLKYADRWYDEVPPCECGLEKALAWIKKIKTEAPQ